ncbi:MAG TPA: hypothetical protein ENI87_15290 [bacterium]|nr:hypothetical protein [bacterium]
MKSTPKWLLIPPVVAALLVLGPLAMSAGASTQTTTEPARATTPSRGDEAANRVAGSLVPKTPDMWKMSSALVGVLLLGAGGIVVLKKLRSGVSPIGNTALATLRQTVRLSTKQALHAIEFDDRILLVGEGEKGLTLIDRGSLPDAASDEAAVLARQGVDVVADDDLDDEAGGAVPKNLVIPRPDRAPQRPARPTSSPAAPSKADKAIATLNDFRRLLQKAGR